jgi:hypothetical protein
MKNKYSFVSHKVKDDSVVNGNGILTTIKAFALGVFFTLTLLGAYWVKTHINALVIAAQYPEVVEQLEIEKNYKVEKK